MATCVWEHLHVSWFPFTHIMVSVKGQEPPTIDLITAALGKQTSVCCALSERVTQFAERYFFFPIQRAFQPQD